MTLVVLRGSEFTALASSLRATTPGHRSFAMCVARAGADWFGDAISPGSRPELIIYRASGASRAATGFLKSLKRRLVTFTWPVSTALG